MRLRLLTLLATVVSIGSPACALTSNAPPREVRFFTVDLPQTTTLRSATLAPTARLPLALGRVRGGGFLRNRIVYRDDHGVLGTYELDRWTEYPEVYLRRSLAGALFGGDRFAESSASGAPTLDAELVRFEEVRRKGARAARVEVDYRLSAGGRVLARDVVSVEREAPEEGGTAPLVDALESALGEVTSRIASAALAVTRAPPGPAHGPSR